MRAERRAAIAFLPLLAPPAGFALAAASGATRAGLAGSALDDVLYGFFLDRYPLFAAAIAYGLARLLAVAVLEPGRVRGLRLLTAPLAAACLLAACLHPTFGGLVLRSGFMVGGVAFANGTPLPLAQGLGAGMAALVFGAVIGLGVVLVRPGLRIGGRSALHGVLSWVALWAGFAALAFPGALGLDPLGSWPRLALAPGPAAGAGLAAFALLPHALLVYRRTGTAGSPASGAGSHRTVDPVAPTPQTRGGRPAIQAHEARGGSVNPTTTSNEA